MPVHITAEEESIINESPEISMGENPVLYEKLIAFFPAFGSTNYILYFFGQLVSLIGTWLQMVAQGWLVLQLTNSAFLIGVVAAAGTLPSLLFSLFGGVIVDRYPKKYILFFTQISSMICAVIMGVLTIMHVITVFEIILLSFLLGIVTALDIPARQAFVVELVDKDSIASAVALNSGIFNAARVIGPSIAGFLIALVGTGGAFVLNGISFIAVVIALYYIRVPIIVSNKHLHPWKAIKEGVAFSFAHPILRVLLIFTGIVSIFGWSYTTVMPVIAQDTFHLDASGLGLLYAAGGLGALVATGLVSGFSHKISSTMFIIGGNILFALALGLFTLTHNLPLALVLLFFSGIGLLTEFATINTAIQHMVDDEVRGRVMSIYSLMFIGLSPLGNVEVGFLAERFSSAFAIQVGAILVFISGIVVFSLRKRIQKEHIAYTGAKNN